MRQYFPHYQYSFLNIHIWPNCVLKLKQMVAWQDVELCNSLKNLPYKCALVSPLYMYFSTKGEGGWVLFGQI